MTIGVLFALSGEDEDKLLDCPAEDRPGLISEDFEDRYAEEWSCDTDKSWDAIHRAFNTSMLTYDFNSPLQGIILGGEALHRDGYYIISYKTAGDVKKISEAISRVTEQDFRKLYFAIREDEYGEEPCEDDFSYCLGNLIELKSFYSKAAGARRCVIFTASQ